MHQPYTKKVKKNGSIFCISDLEMNSGQNFNLENFTSFEKLKYD